MKNRILFLSAALPFALLLGSQTQAQQSINTAGGNATGSGGSVSYSIGQVAYTTASGSAGSVAQGVQHAYDILTSTTEITNGISVSAFPNPTADQISLQVNEGFGKEPLIYQVFDAAGKVVLSGPMQNQITQVPTQQLAPAAYMVRVMNQKNQRIQGFSVIKH